MSDRKKIIHVGSQTIKQNLKNGRTDPPIIVREGSKATRCQSVTLIDANGHPVASMVYSPNKPATGGARIWIETNLEVIMEGVDSAV